MLYLYITIFVVGLLFGSFASLIIHRLHSGEKGIWFGRSQCPKCHHKLAPRDLMPLFSFMLSKGKCRYCKKKISVFYPTLETVMGVMFLITSSLTGFMDIKALVFFLLVTFVFVTISFYDFLFKEIPDEVALPAFVISFLYMWLVGAYGIKELALGVGVPVLFFGLLFGLSRGRWLGGGDIRIGALMGALLAWPNVLLGLFLGYLSGAVYSLFGLATKKLSRKSQIPFAPFLLAGTYVSIFWGEQIARWYLALI